MTKKKAKTRQWVVRMRVSVIRYTDCIEAETAEEAMAIATEEGDPGTHDSDVVDWEAESAMEDT